MVTVEVSLTEEAAQAPMREDRGLRELPDDLLRRVWRFGAAVT